MRTHLKAYLALIFICIVWGTTYLAIRVGVAHYPAFLYAAVRQIISAIIIIAIALMISRKVDLSWNNLRHQMLIGFLLITVGNGMVSWGEKYIPSGVAALICSMMPIFTVIFSLIFSKKDKLNASIVFGLILGFSGVALIFKDNIADLSKTDYLLGILATFLATSSWALGSVYNKKKTQAINPVFNAGLQLLFGGIGLSLFSPVMDRYVNLRMIDVDALWAMLYLIVFGSVLAYTAYMYALKELPVGLVATYAYVNPLVAVILGYFILNEQLTWITGLAFVTIMLGVYLVNRGYRIQHKESEHITANAQTNAASATRINR